MFSTFIPPEKSKWTPPSKRLHKPACEIVSVFSSLQASRYVSYLVYPLCISGAIFSLFYLRQRRWESGLKRWLSAFTFDGICPNWSMQNIFFFFFFPLHSYYSWLINTLVTGEFVCMHTFCWNRRVFPPWPTSDCSPPLRSLRLWLPFNGASAFCQLQGRSCCCRGNISETVNQQINDRLTPVFLPPVWISWSLWATCQRPCWSTGWVLNKSSVAVFMEESWLN